MYRPDCGRGMNEIPYRAGKIGKLGYSRPFLSALGAVRDDPTRNASHYRWQGEASLMATHDDGLAGARLRLAAGVNYQTLGDDEDGVILSLGSGFLYRCNHTAIAILDMLREHPTVDALLDGFAGRFAIDAARAHADVLPLVKHLVEQKLVEKVN